jgi:hypothetical protein
MPPTVHTKVIQLLSFFDSIRHTLSRDKYPTARLVIDASEKHEKGTANTLSGWLNEAASTMRERPLEGFCWTSHSLRKGAATAAYNVGVTLHKIKYFRG